MAQHAIGDLAICRSRVISKDHSAHSGSQVRDMSMVLNLADTLGAETHELSEPLAALVVASTRIHESLDSTVVPQVVVDSACAITGSRFGAVAVLDESGQIQRYATAGMTAEEHRRLADVPNGPIFFKYFGGLKGPLRVADLDAHFLSVRLPKFRPPFEVSSCLVAPIGVGDVFAGFILLTRGTTEPPFRNGDESTLAMFARHATLALTNARRFSREKRARSRLETLLETSPVGVVFFDAQKGEAVRVNQEALRIAGGLHHPDEDPAVLLEAMTVRRADGREISLAELPLARALAAGETVRAEKIVLVRPVGRSLSVLVNATPIFASDGGLASVVVTMQDLTPLEELDRLRANMLGTVSRQLREPLVAVKGAAATLLESSSSLDGAEITQLVRVIDAQASHMRDLIGELVDLSRIETGTLALDLELTEPTRLLAVSVESLTARSGGESTTIDIEPDLPPVRADRRRIAQVLDIAVGVVGESFDGAEPIVVNAAASGAFLHLEVACAGSDAATPSAADLFDQHASDAADGRSSGALSSGEHLALCRGIVEAHGGRLWVERHLEGRGLRVSFTLPFEIASTVAPAPRAVPDPSRSTRAPRVLAIEADQTTQRQLHETLTDAGYDVALAARLTSLPPLGAKSAPDLVLASFDLDDANCLNRLATLRSQANAPLILLSECGHDETGLRAAETGAADFLVKPFTPTELVARVNSALHRLAIRQPTQQPQKIAVGSLVVDLANQSVTVSGERVNLTVTEFMLLRELAVNAGRVVSHTQLMHRIWHTDSSSAVGNVRSAVKRLRRKLGDDAKDSTFVVTVPRKGYRIGSGTTAGSLRDISPPKGNGVTARLSA
ncbi:winged helix-turn-helix domain-containing protein [Candidatus Poriferisodalis sp.]|uniref:winged helix-turn-helix domain-containing protein n=1 Tax=Candidatus Poriferisodalis sp. TaxID=3101277 RepID=UPI003B0215DA